MRRSASPRAHLRRSAERPRRQRRDLATAWWLALVAGLVATVPTALSGFADWLTIDWGSQLWRTATTHLLSMVTATVVFLLAAIFGHSGYVDTQSEAARSH